MRAVILKEFGPPENLIPTEVPDPVPGPDEVLIDVDIANITFVETQLRAGRAPFPGMAPALPVILGNGVGGRLDGLPVVTTTGGKGGYAERAVVPRHNPIPVPEGVPLRDAVALLADGRTATALIRATAPRKGETVLIEAAAGGVGSLLVQLARNAGARVIGLASGARKTALATELGADVAVDYTEPGWEAGVPAVDVVFDGVGGDVASAAFGLLREGGRMSSYGAASGAFARIPDDEAARRGITLVRGAQVTPEQMRELTESALAQAAAGRLRPVIGQTFPLARAADAHAAIESRATIGKTLLIV
ncbi:MAG TPA: zinc-binding dehydrogenase [Streptosporangiaceae bacterium]|nr:zinc-binding dehydrogenase [Streptosporangiaceae bacterium]